MENMELTKDGQIFFKIFEAASKVQGIEVNRDEFLKKQFVGEENIDEIIKLGPQKAKVSLKRIKKLVQGVAKYHTTLATCASVAAGLPGGWWMVGTIPLDISQYYANCLIGAQKIAYLYGFPDIKNCSDMSKNMTLMALLVVMIGEGGANLGKQVLGRHTEKIAGRVIASGGTKTFFYKFINEVAKKLGYNQLTKKGVSEVLKKSIPIVGGFVNGGITFLSSNLAFKKLLAYFEEEYKYFERRQHRNTNRK